MTIANYTGNDVQTSGPGRYTRVTFGGREVWARATRPGAAMAAVLGADPLVHVLGWGNTAGPLWSDLDTETRAALRTTID